jgi:hypothetical protein
MISANRHSFLACLSYERLPVPGTFPIEAKLGVRLDVSEFIGTSIQYPLILFPVFRQDSKIIKST